MKDDYIGYILYYSRKRRGITQSELAQHSNIPQSTIAYIEKAATDKYSRKHIGQAFHVLHLEGELYADLGLHEYMSAIDNNLIAQCAILNSHFASLDPQYESLFAKVLNDHGLPTPQSRYFTSKTINDLIKIATEDMQGMTSVFSMKMQGTFSNIVTPFNIIDDIINEPLNNPFYRLCMALKLKPYDDIMEISFFLKEITKIKFSPPGDVLKTICHYYNEFMQSKNAELKKIYNFVGTRQEERHEHHL